MNESSQGAYSVVYLGFVLSTSGYSMNFDHFSKDFSSSLTIQSEVALSCDGQETMK